MENKPIVTYQAGACLRENCQEITLGQQHPLVRSAVFCRCRRASSPVWTNNDGDWSFQDDDHESLRHGDQALFSKLHGLVVQGLPREPIEWRRSYGRPPKSINIESNFVPFNPDILPTEDDWTLLGRPFFHTYWTDCDIDTYKSMVRDEINEWMTVLKARNISDWLIVVVVYDESKVKSKLLRTSVVDRVKSDFCSKNSDRCITLSEPTRTDSKSSESWGLVLGRMRQLLLQSFNRNLSKFEEYMRNQRERRQETGWSFFQYFLLQEELAFMFEMLGLFDDALVQYDELDALFTQFVLNHAVGASAEWLNNFADITCSTWDGLCLSQPINIEKRHLIKHGRASLLDLRNYLFARQCNLLFLVKRPWEAAQRSIPFMHNCIQELDLLELKLPGGAIACWVFLTCLEVLQTCEKYARSGQTDYSLHTVSLWDYARKKMHVLGVLCGLLPDMTPSSEQLNMVVDLISGMSQNEGESEPLNKLKEALSSKESFTKHYLELSELAMGTYKHIGRMRSARLIGKDLADFYIKQNEYQKAESFLADALKIYKQEGWYMLADDTRLHIARCQKTLNNTAKYVKSSSYVAASQILDHKTRKHYQEEMFKTALQHKDSPVQVRSHPVFSITSLQPAERSFPLQGECVVNLTVVNNLLDPVTVNSVKVALATAESSDTLGQSHSSTGSFKRMLSRESARSRHASTSSAHEMDIYGPESIPPSAAPAELDMAAQWERTVNQTVLSTSVVCKTPIKRLNSGSDLWKDKDVLKGEYSQAVTCGQVVLQPGENHLVLTGSVEDKGVHSVTQLCLSAAGVDFIKNFPPNTISMEVTCDYPSVVVEPLQELIAGLPQKIKATLTPGSFVFSQPTSLTVTGSDGLHVSGDDLQNGVMSVPAANAYQKIDVVLTVTAKLTPDAPRTFDHKITFTCEWFRQPVHQDLVFNHPLKFVHKMHTSGRRKYVQVVVHSNSHAEFQLSDQTLTSTCADVELIPLNKPGQHWVANEHQSVSYVWQMKSDTSAAEPLRCAFSIAYQLTSGEDAQTGHCTCDFTLENYQTHYISKTEVTPCEGSEHCQAGEMSQLKFHIKCVDNSVNQDQLLFYEIVCDTNHWAPAGKTSGVFKLSQGEFGAALEVMPLTGGFLALPGIKIYKYESAKGEEETPEDIKTQLTSLYVGQLYNQTAASQIRVLPAQCNSHLDVNLT